MVCAIIIAAESDRLQQRGKEISILEWQRSAQSDPLITRLHSCQVLNLEVSNMTKIIISRLSKALL